jgi:hypothetical protein
MARIESNAASLYRQPIYNQVCHYSTINRSFFFFFSFWWSMQRSIILRLLDDFCVCFYCVLYKHDHATTTACATMTLKALLLPFDFPILLIISFFTSASFYLNILLPNLTISFAEVLLTYYYINSVALLNKLPAK